MAWVRKRRRTGITRYYVVDGPSTRAAGIGKLGAKRAYEAAAEINRIRARQHVGLSEEVDTRCRWTLHELKDRDMADAKARGLTSLARRESHWAQLLAGFGAETRLDKVTPAAIDRYARARRKAGVGPAVVNRDLRSCLSPALKLARRLKEESWYASNPFADLPPLEERSVRRKPRILTRAEFERLIRSAWAMAQAARGRPWAAEWLQNAAIVELWFLTASRFRQVLQLRREDVRADMVVFPAQKRGKPRAFAFEGPEGRRVKALLAGQSTPWVFPGRAGPRADMKRFWGRLTARAKLPGLHPHDLRHTASREALRQGRGIVGVQGVLGHTGPGATERVYLELNPERLLPVGWPKGGRATLKNSAAKRKAVIGGAGGIRTQPT